MKTLSDWLKQQFEINPRINQTGLAITIKAGQSSVSHWLHGVSVPGPENCRKLAHYFDVPEEEVLILAGHLSPQTRQSTVAENPAPYLDDDITFRQLYRMMKKLSPEARRECLEYCAWRLHKEQRVPAATAQTHEATAAGKSTEPQ